MAIIAVGDTMMLQTEPLNLKFGDLQNPAAAPVSSTNHSITWHKTDKVKLVSDPENTNNMVSP